jgi:glycosyltransferase involved in cell wall biosynthesis
VIWFGEEAVVPADAQVTEVVAPPGPGFAGLDAPRGRRLARTLRIDVMHFAANSGWWSAGATPSVLTLHDVIWARSLRHERTPRQLFGHAYLRLTVPRTLRVAAQVVAPSQTAADAIAARYRRRPTVIANGVGVGWAGAVPDRSRQRPYVVAFAGRDPRKGTEIVLEAWRGVEAQGIGLVLLAGAGIPAELEAELTSLAGERRIELLRYVEEPVLASTVAGALALLYPSRDEGFGLPVAEAMAAGVPVITGLAPVTLEVGGDAVLALDAADPAGSARDAIGRLASDSALRAALSERGRARAAAFSWEATVGAYRQLYEQVLETARTS